MLNNSAFGIKNKTSASLPEEGTIWNFVSGSKPLCFQTTDCTFVYVLFCLCHNVWSKNHHRWSYKIQEEQSHFTGRHFGFWSSLRSCVTHLVRHWDILNVLNPFQWHDHTIPMPLTFCPAHQYISCLIPTSVMGVLDPLPMTSSMTILFPSLKHFQHLKTASLLITLLHTLISKISLPFLSASYAIPSHICIIYIWVKLSLSVPRRRGKTPVIPNLDARWR